jgi:RNA polymerase sigma factor (sigma-70 family)
VDLLRTDHGTISLDSGPDGREDGPPLEIPAGSNRSPHPFAQSTDADPPDPHRAKYLARLDRALLAAFAGLAPRERMLLACYYVDQLTLAEIGRTLGEHESTVSRQLERTRRALRESVTSALQRGTPARDGHAGGAALDDSQVELVFEYALEDWPFDLSRALSKAETAADPPEK